MQADMIGQLREIVEKALSTREPTSAAERLHIYETVRRRLNVFIVQREPSMSELQKCRLFEALEDVIAEIEQRFFVEEPFPILPDPQFEQGVLKIRTKPSERQTKKAGTGSNALIGTMVLVAIIAGTGWYWWSQSASKDVNSPLSSIDMEDHLDNSISSGKQSIILSDLLYERDALKPEYDEKRSAYIMVRDPWRRLQDELSDANTRSDNEAARRLQAEIDELKPARQEALSAWRNVNDRWKEIQNRIENAQRN